MPKEKLRIGVSACLLGERVRWDGGHKLDALLVDTLTSLVDWIPVCPEVESGLGVPRPPMHLAGRARTPRMVVESTGRDVTPVMRRFARARLAELARLELDGYVLKARSPSCGLDVAVRDGERERRGRGLWAAALIRRMAGLPVVEETALADPETRELFLKRAATRARRRQTHRSRGRDADESTRRSDGGPAAPGVEGHAHLRTRYPRSGHGQGER